MNLKRTLLVAALPLVFALPGAAGALTLKASDTHPAGYPTVVAVEKMGKTLEAETNGDIKLQMFAGGVLGTEKEVVEQVQLGAIQLARVTLGVVGPVVPDVNVFNMPFVFRNEQHMRHVIDGEVGQEILDKITNSDFNLVALGWMDGGTRNLYTKKPVRSPEDLKGMKIRMIGNPVFLDTMNAMGGNGISMDTSEVFSALQTGVVDGAENNPPTMLEHNHYQIAKYYTLTGHLIIPELLVMSKTTWEKLTPEQQVLVKKAARQAQMDERQLWDAKVASSTEKLKAAGVEYISIDPKPFYDATAPVREKYGAKYADLMKKIAEVQ
jgi:tripartite ATP-independent transporter DctP family solute receptor